MIRPEIVSYFGRRLREKLSSAPWESSLKLVGLHGPRRVGKDSIAEFLRDEYGFEIFSFSDALYVELAEAYSASLGEDVAGAIKWMKSADVKDTRCLELALRHCADEEFVESFRSLYTGASAEMALSPRAALQHWGTEYRRAQDPDYWVKKADEWLRDRLEAGAGAFVNTSVRFPNEAAWVRRLGRAGADAEIWHVERPGGVERDGHVSDDPLVKRTGDRLIINGGTLEDLRGGVQALLRGSTIVNTTTFED